MDVLSELKTRDGLLPEKIGSLEAYIHEDHRRAPPLTCDLQTRNLLPRPCDIVVFDRHYDCLLI